MFNFGSSKKRRKSPASQLKKVNTQIQKEKTKIELKRAKATLANMRLKG